MCRHQYTLSMFRRQFTRSNKQHTLDRNMFHRRCIHSISRERRLLLRQFDRMNNNRLSAV